MSAAVSREDLVSPEGQVLAEQITAEARAKRAARPVAGEPFRLDQDIFPQYRAAPAPVASAPPRPKNEREIERMIVDAKRRRGAALAGGKIEQVEAVDDELLRLERSLRTSREIERARIEREASPEYAAAKRQEEEELARQQEAEAEVERQIAAHATKLGELLVQVDDLLRAELWMRPREGFSGRPDAPPPWLDHETQLRVLAAAADHLAAAVAGRAGLGFAGSRLAELARTLQGRFLTTGIR